MFKIFKFKHAYCDNCEKEVIPKRKVMDGMYINVWILIIISSLGFGIIPFIIYRYIYLKKNLCRNCNSQVEFYDSPEEIPEPKSQIIRILIEIDEEKKTRENDDAKSIFCPFCQKEMKTHVNICPNCGASLLEE